jgi:hypothetical protein
MEKRGNTHTETFHKAETPQSHKTDTKLKRNINFPNKILANEFQECIQVQTNILLVFLIITILYHEKHIYLSLNAEQYCVI